MKNLKQQWIKSFSCSLKELEGESDVSGDPAWTRFMTKVFQKTGDNIHCYVQSKFLEEKNDTGEFLNIDAMYFNKGEINDWQSEYAPQTLPVVVIEHENMDLTQKIEYCLWKILCIKAPLRILICYKNDNREIHNLKDSLEKLIKKIKVSNDEDILVIIGNKEKENSTWDEYFNCYEWEQNKLQEFNLL